MSRNQVSLASQPNHQELRLAPLLFSFFLSWALFAAGLSFLCFFVFLSPGETNPKCCETRRHPTPAGYWNLHEKETKACYVIIIIITIIAAPTHEPFPPLLGDGWLSRQLKSETLLGESLCLKAA